MDKMASPSDVASVLISPCKRVRAELVVQTVWIENTVFPDALVWRVWFDNHLLVDTSRIGMKTPTGLLAYGLQLQRVTRHRPQTRLGPARACVARLATSDGHELEATLRITDQSVFCSVRQRHKRQQTGCLWACTQFPEASVLLLQPRSDPSDQESPDKYPQVRFTPQGKIMAFWQHGLTQHVVLFDRPADLAMQRFPVFAPPQVLLVENGRAGCEHLFLTLPFLNAPVTTTHFGTCVTPAYQAAFALMLSSAFQDDTWMIRGEPGVFAIVARREGANWQVGGITATARTVTLRFEDLWWRMPEKMRASAYYVTIQRDPIKDERGASIEESFSEQAPDVRIALDLAANGGFLITFRPMASVHAID